MDETRSFIPVRIAVLTVSDTRNMVDDRSGETLVKRIGESGHMLVDRRIVRDDIEAIVAVISAWCQSSDVDVVISTGGTGLTGRDVTVEAHRRVYEKEIDGFSTLFHMVSAEKIGTSTMQSRACGGVCNGVYLFALPGSPSACKDGWDQILRWQLDHRHRPCNLVEIMPRLIEGR